LEKEKKEGRGGGVTIIVVSVPKTCILFFVYILSENVWKKPNKM